MKHSIKMIFGKEQVSKFISNIPLTSLEQEINIREYKFDTEAELIAFKKGVDETIGWLECHLVEG